MGCAPPRRVVPRGVPRKLAHLLGAARLRAEQHEHVRWRHARKWRYVLCCGATVGHVGGGGSLLLVRVAVAMAVATILVVVAAACPVYMAVLSLSLPVIVAAARTMLVTVLSLRVRVAVLVLGLRHGRRRQRCRAWVPNEAKLARDTRHDREIH